MPLCRVCIKSIYNNQSQIKCDFCNSWVHLKCSSLSNTEYEHLKQYSKLWLCVRCISESLPFHSTPALHENLNNSQYKELFSHLNQRLEYIQENEEDDNFDNFNILPNCSYMDIEEFNNKFLPTNDGFSLFHLNIASLSLHFENLDSALCSLDKQFDVIGISETRIQSITGSSSNLNISGFSFEDSPTECSAGGTGLYISENLVYERRSDLEMYKKNELESTFIEIIYKESSNIIVSCIYRHPSMPLNEFNDDFLQPLITKLSAEHNKRIYLMGDFNVDLLKADRHLNSSTFLDILESNNFSPKIILPTRVTSNSRTLIDNIFTNQLDQNTFSGNLDLSISDHLPQFLVTSKCPAPITKKHNIMVRNMRDFDQNKFISDIRNTDWDRLLNCDQGDINHSFDSFLNKFNNILDNHAPLKKANKKNIKLQQKPWITKGILNSIKKRDNLFRQFRKCQRQGRKIVLYNRYKVYRNQIVSLIKLSKKLHMQNFFRANSKNTRKVWQGIRDIISLRKTSVFTPSHIVSHGISYTDPQSIADSFNHFFSTIGNKIQEKVYSNHVNFQSYLNNPSCNSIFLTPTTSHEVLDVVNAFKKNKSLGPNSIPNNILGFVSSEISPFISKLINLSFETGVFPSALKLAKVVPVHKKGSQVDLDNYRPISLLSNINKIFEKIMYDRVYKFMSNQNSFFEKQFGFRDKHSTAHALISLTEHIRESLDSNKFVCGIFIDLKKAFDTVNHNILLEKLNYYGIRGKSNEWFKSYLTDRSQFVSINGFDSKILKTNIGVPQGSVLGPLLFLIYINDLNTAIKHSLVHHFADDTNLLHINTSMQKLNKLLNQDLKALCNWLKANKIALNVTKTEFLFFRSPQKVVTDFPNLKIDGKLLLPSHSVKYLGIYIDEYLSFNQHSINLVNKLRRSNGMLSKIRHYVPVDVLRSIYYAIFESHLSYCCMVWGQKGNKIVDKLITLQNAAMRLLTFSTPRQSSKPLYHQLGILQFRQQVELQNVVLVNSSLNKLAPISLQNMFVLRRDAHERNLRNPLRITQNNVRTTRFGLNSIKSQCISVWNKFVDFDVISDVNWPMSNNSLKKTIKIILF